MNPIEEWLTQPDGLAVRLRALRTQAGLSGKNLAAAVGWAASKVSRIETGQLMPKAADVDSWVRACGADPTSLHGLLALLDEASANRLEWKRRMRRGQSAVQTNYNRLVAGSAVVRHFETVYIPGLLQTPAYARRVLIEMVELHGLDVDDVEASVAVRMQRQPLIYDEAKRFEFLLAEPVLRWQLCSSDVMRGQLDRLQTIVDLPNVRFGILPLGRVLVTAPQNSFSMYDDDLAIVETFIGESMHRDNEAAAYLRVMELMWGEAATGDDARRLLVRAAADLP